jgi:hypothetical protein
MEVGKGWQGVRRTGRWQRSIYEERSIEVGEGCQGDKSPGRWQRSIQGVAWRLEKAGRETEALAAGREAYSVCKE